MNQPACPFCKDSIQNSVFAESEFFNGIYNRAPIVPGHVLIISKHHKKSFLECSDAELSDFILFARTISSRLLVAFEAEAFNISLQDGRDAGQTVDHLHWHLLPRKENDFESPGDWYPAIEKSESNFLDSSERPHLSSQDMETIVIELRRHFSI